MRSSVLQARVSLALADATGLEFGPQARLLGPDRYKPLAELLGLSGQDVPTDAKES